MLNKDFGLAVKQLKNTIESYEEAKKNVEDNCYDYSICDRDVQDQYKEMLEFSEFQLKSRLKYTLSFMDEVRG